MKTFRFAKYVVLTGAIGLLGSCDSFLDVNVNPNAVVVAPAGSVMVAAQTQLGFLMGSDLHRFTSLIAQQFAGHGGLGIQTVVFDRGIITGTDVNNLFRTTIYAAALADMQQLIVSTQETSPVYAGIAKIMQGFLFSVTIDSFGDVPVSEALKFATNGRPVYDKSEDGYKFAIGLIDAGIEDIKKASALKPGVDDLIYGGDLAKWERFANTLKLRMYLHYFPKLSQNSNADFATLLAKGPTTFMSGLGDNFQLRFENTVGKTNSIDQFERARPNTFYPSTSLVGIMNTKADPRRPFFFTDVAVAPATGVYIGAGNGTGVGAPTPNAFSRMHTYLRGARTGTGLDDYAGNTPIRMLTFAEYQFILAEYYVRTGNLALAQTAFNAGINASMTMAGVTAAAADVYVKARPALTADNGIQQIIEEKFVANYGVAVEPWTDYRRTGFPVLTVPANGQSTSILRILPYSDADRAANPANTPARTDLTTPSVFWDPGKK
ncbi:SusD/RagB family nutrient-binding outer membrane lipoprotein [Hymenobacter elongatus]|uniref:SusD/RagB family nutrient-binding outer membrane lipoprotein n=1 Tax=Hymenobacter elongatus TaxID=877208 RepID=A0A4Z0PQ80_9BACT|nr:SusD/RagB family nutrient-binding outer membrane lipoprotein [Hymenobacter elongatus]TGE19251.1 SusD/RagB family nutrient-binding outer membrane lipoprotein [Hymenobacter elongatus]